jgi:hypothetical protein
MTYNISMLWLIFSAIIATMAAPTMRECLTIPTESLAATSSGIRVFSVSQTRGWKDE